MASTFPTAQPASKTDYDSDTAVASSLQNAQGEDINAIAAKVGHGTNDNAPATNKILRGTATGKSEWDFDIKDEDAMTSNSATAVPTQQSTKAYVDTHAADTTTHGATGAVVGTTNEQALSVKTLTTPVIASLYQDAGKTKLMTTPNTASDTLCAIAATQTLSGKTLTSPLFQGSLDGWISANETWTYASVDDPTFTFTIAAFDATAKYSPGMKVKLTNATVKYFIITKVVFDDPGSTITVYGGTDYNLVDAAITSPYYSTMKAPLGFPLAPDKWTVEVNSANDRSTATPTANTWYNAETIIIPIGIWRVEHYAPLYGTSNAAQTAFKETVTLSTANNSESDSVFSGEIYTTGASGTIGAAVVISRSKVLVLAAKTNYYLNYRTTLANMASIYVLGASAEGPTIIRAICVFL